MTKKQRIRKELELIISQNALGAGRTAAIQTLAKKYSMTTKHIDKVAAIFVQYPAN